MGLEAVAAGDPGEHESPAFRFVLRRELHAQFLDLRDRQLDELRQHTGLDRLGGREHHRFDRAASFPFALVGRFAHGATSAIDAPGASALGC